ncbi:MAG: ABC transporter ATP-binding protein [Cyclobacteriaceae bacterium]
MHILEAHNIHKSYSDHQALTAIDLIVPSQTIFGLLGPNGAGKTTLIRIITQILQADEGEILINGEILDPKHIGMIGYLPEERGLYKKMRVGEQLLYLARLKGLTRIDAIVRIKAWLEKLNMTEWTKKNIEDLSKGMQQKIQFIATVLHHPQLIILDEPFSGFDPINANIIKDEILQMREEGSTIIFSTHRMESVEELCDHIALINKSRKILDGPKKQIKKTYQTNTFMVDHIGPLNGLPAEFELIASNLTEEEMFHSTVRITGQAGPNELLTALVQQTEIHSFTEKIPSMNEIFISKVNEGNG